MRKISSIKITNNYVLLTFNDKTKFKISEDDYFEYKFKANMEIDDKMFYTIKNISNYHEAYMSALNKIKYKDRTEYEIRSHLYDDYNLLKPDVDEIIEKLKRYDFINDIRYTHDFIERSKLKDHGYQKIKSGLIEVRISSDYIEEIHIYNFKEEYQRAFDYAERSLKSIRNKNKVQIEQALRQKLMYRGYKQEVVNAVLFDIEIDVDEDVEFKLLEKDYERLLRRYSRRYEGYELRVRIFNALRTRGYEYQKINDLLDRRLESNE